MALDKATLITDLTSSFTTIFEDLSGKDADVKAGEMANAIADAIDIYVKTATVATTVTVASVSLVTPGVGVSGPGAGTGTGTLS